MMKFAAFLSSIFLAITSGHALSADYGAPQTHKPWYAVSEVRMGVMAHDYRWRERGSKDLQAEILFQPLYARHDDPSFWDHFLSPRPHIGASLNTGGKTSYLYGGLSWDFPMGQFFFIEGTFGGAVHNGELNNVHSKHEPLGTRALFRESASIGFKIKRIRVMATIEHLSNGGIGKWNHGLSNFGTRVGFDF